jgi:hypothetical protein
MMKKEGPRCGSISQRQGSADPDPYQKVMDTCNTQRRKTEKIDKELFVFASQKPDL